MLSALATWQHSCGCFSVFFLGTWSHSFFGISGAICQSPFTSIYRPSSSTECIEIWWRKKIGLKNGEFKMNVVFNLKEKKKAASTQIEFSLLASKLAHTGYAGLSTLQTTFPSRSHLQNFYSFQQCKKSN